MISKSDSQQFLALFKGKNDTYVRNEFPKEKPTPGRKTKTTIANISGEVNSSLVKKHLDGEFGLGICPVDKKGTCYFGAIDIDVYGKRIIKMIDIINDYHLPLLPFRSKSGGLHVYLMLSKPIQAKSMREILRKIIQTFSLDQIYGKNKLELFPKQNTTAKNRKGFGSSITLPYFNAQETYTYLVDAALEPVSFKEALTIIPDMLTSLKEVEALLEELPFNDAPPCIQRIILTNQVGSDSSGRNNFLYSFAIYAKKKHGSNFGEHVIALNKTFKNPLEEDEVLTLISSIKNNEYLYKCNDIPCEGFCDKGTCKKREYGLGKEKGHFTNIDYGTLYRYMSIDPYYIWKLRLQGQEKWVDVLFKNEGMLLDQNIFAQRCVRYLNQAPRQVSREDWFNILNSVLPNVEEIKVDLDSDSSATALLKQAFYQYLANKMAENNKPFLIHIGLCVKQMYKTEAGDKIWKYYFIPKGLIDFLKTQKVNFDLNLLMVNLEKFGAEKDTLIYSNAVGEVQNVECWSKKEDAILTKIHSGVMEVEAGDKTITDLAPVGTATNIKKEEPKPQKGYTDKDKQSVADLF